MGSPKALHSMGSAVWQTPPEILDLYRASLGGIDTDPCTHEGAIARVGAHTYGTEARPLPLRAWVGQVYCNPPSPPYPWWEACVTYSALHPDRGVGFLAYSLEILTQIAREGFPAGARLYLAPARIRFLRPDGAPGDRPSHGSAAIMLGSHDPRPWARAGWARFDHVEAP